MSTHPTDSRAARPRTLPASLRRLMRMNEAVVFLVVVIVFSALSFISPYFLTEQNLRTLAIGLAAEGIVVVGMTLALASGGFDLSVGGVMGLAAIVTATLAAGGVGIWVASLVGLLVGAVVGSVNGLLISRVQINPFITTLGMMTISRGLVYVLTDGSSISLAGADPAFRELGTGTVLGLPVIVVIFAVIAIVGDILMRRSAFVRKTYYVGSNAKAAALSGIRVGNVQFNVYFVVGLLAALAGILSLARFGTATPSMGAGAEMRVISAAVIGGASLTGGAGTVLGSVLGLVLLSLISNALVLLQVSVNWQSAISGAILIVAVGIDTVSRRRPRRHVGSATATRPGSPGGPPQTSPADPPAGRAPTREPAAPTP